MDKHDKELGMGQSIARRDLLQGIASLAAAGSLSGGLFTSANAQSPPRPSEYYPPALTGLRGQHPGSFETAHQLRDAKSWTKMRESATPLQESYDLIVVGAGLSGLA